MLKHFKALKIAGLTTLSAGQLALATQNTVLWTPDRENSELISSEIKIAAQAIAENNQRRPLVRFSRNEPGGSALVPLLPVASDGRCSPDFDLAPFHAEKGSEVWANFEFVNIDENDADLLAFAIKADKPGRKDRLRTAHDIGCGRLGKEPAMNALIAPPTDGDYGFYFVDQSLLKTDELLQHNPGAAIRITISNRAHGNVT